MVENIPFTETRFFLISLPMRHFECIFNHYAKVRKNPTQTYSQRAPILYDAICSCEKDVMMFATDCGPHYYQDPVLYMLYEVRAQILDHFVEHPQTNGTGFWALKILSYSILANISTCR